MNKNNGAIIGAISGLCIAGAGIYLYTKKAKPKDALCAYDSDGDNYFDKEDVYKARADYQAGKLSLKSLIRITLAYEDYVPCTAA